MEVDAAPTVDLNRVLNETRAQYEALVDPQVTPCDPMEFLPLQWPCPPSCLVWSPPSRFWQFLINYLIPHPPLPVLSRFSQVLDPALHNGCRLPVISTFAFSHSM